MALLSDSSVPTHNFLQRWAIWSALHRYRARAERLRQLEATSQASDDIGAAHRAATEISHMLTTAAARGRHPLNIWTWEYIGDPADSLTDSPGHLPTFQRMTDRLVTPAEIRHPAGGPAAPAHQAPAPCVAAASRKTTIASPLDLAHALRTAIGSLRLAPPAFEPLFTNSAPTSSQQGVGCDPKAIIAQ